ncbi:MAG: integrase [Chromatiales bacterium]|nr:MAG: integrase [Chromatiales bacterium]
MARLRESVEMAMRLRGFSPRTHESYIHALEELWRFYKRPLERLSCQEVQLFLDEIIRTRNLAWATVNVYFSAYRFLYEQVLRRTPRQFSIPPRGRSRTRPGILSREEVMRLIEAPPNVKHRALLSLAYGSGLRVSELVRVMPVHVDRDRMALRVEQGKGHKDRYTILAGHTLALLEAHWRANRPTSYFFYGENKALPMSVGTAQQIYYQAVKRSGVRRVGGIHVLRHCFASHALDDGQDLYALQRWMGHTAMSTTAGYLHMTPGAVYTITSPADRLFKKA